jgi:hypothetical protein
MKYTNLLANDQKSDQRFQNFSHTVFFSVVDQWHNELHSVSGKVFLLLKNVIIGLVVKKQGQKKGEGPYFLNKRCRPYVTNALTSLNLALKFFYSWRRFWTKMFYRTLWPFNLPETKFFEKLNIHNNLIL